MIHLHRPKCLVKQNSLNTTPQIANDLNTFRHYQGGNILSEGYTLQESLDWFAEIKHVFRGEGTHEEVAALREMVKKYEVDDEPED